MASTYEKIATTTLSSASATVTFSSISGAYTDLIAIITAKANTSADVYVRCNGDSGTNYSYTGISGSGSAASSFRVSNTSNGLLLDNLGYADNNNNQIILVSFNNYSNTTTYKTSICRSNNAATGVDALVGLWRSTSAINELTFRLNSTHQYQTGTVITLYGILKWLYHWLQQARSRRTILLRRNYGNLAWSNRRRSNELNVEWSSDLYRSS